MKMKPIIHVADNSTLLVFKAPSGISGRGFFSAFQWKNASNAAILLNLALILPTLTACLIHPV